MGVKKWMRRVRTEAGQALTVQLLCLGLLFVIGMLGGYLYADYCGDHSRLVLSEYLAGYCALYEKGTVQTVSLFAAVRLYFSYVLAALFLGFLSIGVFALPVLSGIYGFMTMFAVACFIQVYGRAGSALAMAAFGLRALFTIPCFLWVAAYAWAASSALATRSRGKRCAPVVYDSAYFYRLLLCFVLLMIGICAERYITPYLFQWALAKM